jgi:hypothetical protein
LFIQRVEKKRTKKKRTSIHVELIVVDPFLLVVHDEENVVTETHPPYVPIIHVYNTKKNQNLNHKISTHKI